MRKAAHRLVESRDFDGKVDPEDLRDRARRLVQTIGDEAETHPFRTVGIAAGAGFILGGGLLTPLTARTFRAGLQLAVRLAVLPALTRGLAMMGERMLDDLGQFKSSTNEGDKK